MDVRFHEHPGIEGGLRFQDVFAQAGKKTKPILIVVKYL